MTTPSSPPSPKPNVPSTPSISPSASKPVIMKGIPPFEISKPSVGSSRWLNMMVYGKPGAGKTTLLGTAADVEDMRDILHVDAESGNLAIEDNPRIKHPEFLTDNRVRVTNFKQVAMVHDFLKGHCKYRDENNTAKLIEYESWLRGCSPDEIKEPKKFRTGNTKVDCAITSIKHCTEKPSSRCLKVKASQTVRLTTSPRVKAHSGAWPLPKTGSPCVKAMST